MQVSDFTPSARCCALDHLYLEDDSSAPEAGECSSQCLDVDRAADYIVAVAL